MENKNLVELKNVLKTFGEVVALDNVTFTAEKGKIHGLLGENGAGKSTLMNILYGLYSPDKGEIYIDNKKVKIKSPFDSIKLGIGMVHQISTLVPEFNAVENIILGTPEDKFKLPIKEEQEKVKKIMKELGLTFPLDIKTKKLPAGVKQKIEIIRSLHKGAKLLILDEPTTSLVESEFRQLLKSLRTLVKKGVTVIFITHKIKEIMESCDSVTVLRRGKVQDTINKEQMTKEKLVKLMFMEKDIKVTESALPKVELPTIKRSKKPVCTVKNIEVKGKEKSKGLKNISFDVYGGEILGVASVSGNGEKELASIMIDPSLLSNGDIFVNGESIKRLSTLSVFNKGVAYTPEDRIKEGILNDGSIKENVLLGHHTEKRFFKKNLFIDWDEATKAARKTIKDYNVSTPSEELAIRRLSGGNIQKVIMGRAFVSPTDLLITHNPTSGLDVLTVEFIFNKLVETRNNGGAVLCINEDLDELMIISDRIAVLHNGELRGIFQRSEFDKYKIGLLMIGG
ncbi:MAG: ABC transporter ATP-binding protein [Caldisericota bacterium]|nr:ABC transporter ATP-binding protein [Caldisericota bacterium]